MCLANLILVSPTISAPRSTQCSLTYSSIELRQLHGKDTHEKRLKILTPGAAKIIQDVRINRKWNKTSTKARPRNHLNMDNLINMTVTNKIGNETTSTTRIATLKARYVKNKDQAIIGELNNRNVDIAVLSETWLKDNTEDQAWLNQSDFKQSNYDTLTHNIPSEKNRRLQ